MYCYNCGTELTQDDRFCKNCGRRNISFVEPSQQPRNESQSTGYRYKDPEENNYQSSYNNPNVARYANEQQDNTPPYYYESSSSNRGSYISGISVAALIFGLLGGWLGLVFGIIGLSKFKDSGNRAMCIIGMVAWVFWVIVQIIILASM